MQVDQVLLGDHRAYVADEPVHGDGLNNAVWHLIYNNEAANLQGLNLGCECLVVDLLNLMVAFTYQSLEACKVLCPNDSLRHHRHDEPESILDNSVDALYILTVLCLIASKDLAAGADDVKLMPAISQQQAIQLLRDIRDLTHLTLVTSDQLLHWERCQSVVRAYILRVRVVLIAPEELEVRFVVLNDIWDLFDTGVTHGDLWCMAVELVDFLDYRDEEA